MAERLRSRSSGGRFSGCVSSVNFQSLKFLENLFLLADESLPLLFFVGDFEGERRDEARECEGRCCGRIFSLGAESSGCFLGEVELLLKKLGRTISDRGCVFRYDSSGRDIPASQMSETGTLIVCSISISTQQVFVKIQEGPELVDLGRLGTD